MPPETRPRRLLIVRLICRRNSTHGENLAGGAVPIRADTSCRQFSGELPPTSPTSSGSLSTVGDAGDAVGIDHVAARTENNKVAARADG